MSQLKALKSANTRSEVARLLRFKPSSFSYVLYKLPDPRKYKKFEIAKRYGGKRQICAPSSELKLIQRRLADLLQSCIEDINEEKGINVDGNLMDRISHGFKRNRSIITNAKWHRHRRYVFNIDIENFFESINFGRVRGFFISDKNFRLDPTVATVLAKISCHDNSLPQGSPCSPVISNLIGHILDIHLVKLAMRVGCTYTRYADDLTFSTNKQEFPKNIAYKKNTPCHSWAPGDGLCQIIERSGFAINKKKTRMQYKDSRQEVTGLIVNDKINVKREYKHNVRAMVHRLFTTGGFEVERVVKENGKMNNVKVAGKLSQLHGMLGFIEKIDQYNRHLSCKAKVKGRRELNSIELMYRRFLMYKEFYASTKPVVICEGKTDNVYLTHAIRSLAENYPTLASVDAQGKIDIKIRRFKYTGNSTGRILNIGSGGAPNLFYLVIDYRSDIAKFHAPGLQHPIIVLIDNDSAVNKFKNLVNKSDLKTRSFTHLFKNLYLVATPLIDDAEESTIEEFFDDSVKKTKLGGKIFSSKNYKDENSYGKTLFAYKVIEPNASKIDFSGFEPLLDRFVEVIEFHKKHFTTEFE